MPPKSSKFDIKTFGSRIRANNKQELKKKLDIRTVKDAEYAVKNIKNNAVLHDPTTGQVVKVDKENHPPYLLRHFLGVDRFKKEYKDKLLLNKRIEPITDDMNVRPIKKRFEAHDNILVRITMHVRIVVSNDNGTLARGSDRDCYIKSNIDGGERLEIKRKYPKNKKMEDKDMDTGLYLATAGELKEMKYKHLIVYNSKSPKYRYYINESKMTEKKIENGSFYKIWDDEANNIRNPNMKLLNYDEQPEIIKAMLDKMYKHYAVKAGAEFCILDSISLNGSTNQDDVYNETKMRMFKALDISNISVNLYNEVINISNTDENCVIATLSKMYKSQINIKKYFLKHSPNYEEEGISTDEIYEFCRNKKIKMLCYGIDGEIKKKHIPEKPSKLKVLCYIQYNNHMYLIKNQTLKKKEHFNLKNELKTEDELNSMFYELLSRQIIPANIRLSKLSKNHKPIISSFIHEDIMYFSNNDYLLCERILESLGVKHMMTPYINKYNLISTLEDLYGIYGVKSFFPQLAYHDFDILLYESEYFKNLEEKQIAELNPIILDKSKAYGNALYNLKELPIVDIRHMPRIIYTDQPIHKSYIYYIVPSQHSILIPNAIYANGEDVLYYQSHNLIFSIVHYYEADTSPNVYKNLIHDYYTKTKKIAQNKQEQDDIKRIINIFIGKMEYVDKKYSNIKVKKVCNETEAMLSNGQNTKLNDSNHLIWEEESGIKKGSIYTGKLIKCMLMNKHRQMIFEKMISMNVSENRLVYLKTDAICFIPREEDKHLYTTESDDYKGWKIEEYKPFHTENEYELRKYEDVEMTHLNRNILYDCYAGTGKSYLIKNKIIKKIEEEGKSYIVLTPSHSSVMEYRKEGYKNAVIQTYDYISDIPNYDVVIVDELGLCSTSAHSVLYRYMITYPHRQLICAGDHKQLLPPRDQLCDQKDYLSIMFGRKRILDINRRNNFTIPYYDSLINETVKLSDEIRKYNSPIDEAEYIMIPTNKQIDIMNEYLLDKYGLTMYSPGLEVMCKSNKLRNQDIYNNYKLIFDSIDIDDNVYLHDETNEYKITKKQYDAYFKYSKCRTLYNCQGMSIKSYHVPEEHISYFASSGRFAYTLISRLKQEIKQVEITEKQEIKETPKMDMMNINFDTL